MLLRARRLVRSSARRASSRAAASDAGVAEAPDPDAPTVAAHADRAEAHVGDPIHLDVVAIGKARVPVNLPGTLELGPFSLLDRKESEQDLGDGRMKRQFTLTVAAYEPGAKRSRPSR